MEFAARGVDGAILATYLLAVVLLGIWLGRGQRSLADYLLAGRRVAWPVVLFSIVATETSTVTFLSIPGLAFDPAGGSMVFLQLSIGLILGRLIVVGLLLPHYFAGDLLTAYQVLDRRFGGAAKQTASALFLVTRNLADGLRLYLTALVLVQLTGLDLVVSIAVIGATTILYTCLGGMRSVVWNDCLQFLVYMTGALLAGWVIVRSLPGGWTEFVQFGQAEGKFRVVDAALDFTRPYTIWSGVIGGAFLALTTHGTDQMMVQRYLSAGNRAKAGLALGLSGLVIAAQFAVFLLVGAGLAAYYHAFPDASEFSRNDEVFAAFIVNHMPPGITGLTLAAVFAAAMSTLSSSLSSSASAAIGDFYLPLRGKKCSEKHLLRAGRVFTLLFGLVQVAVAVGGRFVTASVVSRVLAIAGFTAGPVLGIFFLGVLTRRVTQRDALAGLLGGLALLTTLALGTELAWPWYAVVGAGATFAFGLAASLLPR